jgi:hypothetical protein
MKTPFANLLALVGTAATVVTLAGSARAASRTFNFSYTFVSSGKVLAGSLQGELQPDGDTVFIDGFGTVTLGGVTLPSIEPSEIRSISDFPDGLLQPLVSFSASHMDVFVCAQGFVFPGMTPGNCDAAATGGFFLNAAATAAPRAGAGDAQGFFTEDFGDFRADRWVLTPEPASAMLIGFAVAGLAACRARTLW